MKAKVQYNDFVGTAAADISDHIDLEKYLEKLGVDTKVYTPIGVDFRASGIGNRGEVNFSIICKDTEKDKLVVLYDSTTIKFEDFIILFKRFNVVLTIKGHVYTTDTEHLFSSDLPFVYQKYISNRQDCEN